MLIDTSAVCVAIVFFNCACRNCNKGIPQENFMTDFRLSEPKKDFIFIWTMHLAVSYSQLLTQHSLKPTSI
jgi:hypothetical protein